MTTRKARCPGCRAMTRDPDLYFGPECWQRLPEAVRLALYLRDGEALKRYKQVLSQLGAGILLEAISLG